MRFNTLVTVALATGALAAPALRARSPTPQNSEIDICLAKCSASYSTADSIGLYSCAVGCDPSYILGRDLEKRSAATESKRDLQSCLSECSLEGTDGFLCSLNCLAMDTTAPAPEKRSPATDSKRDLQTCLAECFSAGIDDFLCPIKCADGDSTAVPLKARSPVTNGKRDALSCFNDCMVLGPGDEVECALSCGPA